MDELLTQTANEEVLELSPVEQLEAEIAGLQARRAELEAERNRASSELTQLRNDLIGGTIAVNDLAAAHSKDAALRHDVVEDALSLLDRQIAGLQERLEVLKAEHDHEGFISNLVEIADAGTAAMRDYDALVARSSAALSEIMAELEVAHKRITDQRLSFISAAGIGGDRDTLITLGKRDEVDRAEKVVAEVAARTNLIAVKMRWGGLSGAAIFDRLLQRPGKEEMGRWENALMRMLYENLSNLAQERGNRLRQEQAQKDREAHEKWQVDIDAERAIRVAESDSRMKELRDAQLAARQRPDFSSGGRR